jgi:nitrogen fixation/metabolism regulation signal transduction histidine kinase
VRALIVVGGTVGAVGLFLLATASADTPLLALDFRLLVSLNAVLALLLAVLVAYQLVTVVRRYRARVFGTRLTLRLLARFALLAVVPGLLVYAVSVHFLTRSIESWFDVKVDAALEGGLTLGQQAIEQMALELQSRARTMALELGDRPLPQLVTALERQRQQAGVQELVVVSAGGRLVASASEDISKLVPELPAPNALRQARTNRAYSMVDADGGRPLSLRVIVPMDTRGIGEEQRFLQVRQGVPPSFGRSAEAVETAYRDYRELALSRDGLKRIYVVTLTFALLMALFVAVAIAVTQSNLLAEPLSNLAQATQAVARGDFSRQAPVTSRDELGVLTESFNSMTRQLGEARRSMDSSRQAVEEAKVRLENILGNLSAGVLVFDHDLRLSITNRGAHAILGEGHDDFAAQMREEFAARGAEPWQLDLALRGTGKTLHVRAAALPMASGGGYVLVFDDITQLVHAQRAMAWSEVARRLAHEIKNPLTPIQLSAERLQMKLGAKVGGEDATTLRRATETIVNQVSALKAMVDDFANYARLPAPALIPLDLNRLVAEVLSLYENSPVPVVARLASGLAPVRADPAQIRQVIHNLVQNSQDALEQARGRQAPPAIEVRTEPSGDQVRLSVLDSGGGFPPELMARIFEPYVTTKARGTGLGLAIVKKIVDEHDGTISIENRDGGAVVSLLLPTARS